MTSPRLIGGGIVDTINTNAHAYTMLQPRAITNQFAAMPSLHFGWVLAGIAIFVPRGLRWLGVLPPGLTAFSVVARRHAPATGSSREEREERLARLRRLPSGDRRCTRAATVATARPNRATTPPDHV